MSLRVLQKGVQSIPVDLGRKHFQHLGVTVGGPMDLHAFLWANHLLDNANNEAQIEIAHGHFSCEFMQPTMIAITGADQAPLLNGMPLETWKSVNIKKGDRLTLGAPVDGFYSYLAIVDGFQIPQQLGSVTAVKRDRLGGLHQDGLGLENNDEVAYAAVSARTIKRTPQEFIPNYGAPLSLGVIPSYQHDDFGAAQRKAFYQQTFNVSPKINRQGVCLNGEPIQYPGPNIISEGIAYGAIQIPPDGQPIILMRDRQSIGGYPKIGCIATLDVGKLAQQKPGNDVSFTLCDAHVSLQSYSDLLHFFSA